jgi:signal recognition particle subunit SRP54
MVQSMTKEERKNIKVLNKGRVRRVAEGSGTTANEVNRLTTQFEMVQKMTASLASGGMASRMQAA